MEDAFKRIENLQVAIKGLGPRHLNNTIFPEDTGIQKTVLSGINQDHSLGNTINNSILHDAAINLPSAEKQILANKNMLLPAAAMVNAGVMALNGINRMIATENLSQLPIFAEQLIKIEKINLIILLDKYHKVSDLDYDHKKYLKKFLEIRRGGTLKKLKSKFAKTRSQKLYSQIIKSLF